MSPTRVYPSHASWPLKGLVAPTKLADSINPRSTLCSLARHFPRPAVTFPLSQLLESLLEVLIDGDG